MLFLFLAAFAPPDKSPDRLSEREDGELIGEDGALYDPDAADPDSPGDRLPGDRLPGDRLPEDRLPGDREVLGLVKRAKGGDDEAFSQLVTAYERFVYHVACRVLSASAQSQDMAEDIAQEAFLKAWRNLSRFRGECTFSTWLFRITVNCAKDAVRSAARRPVSSLSFAGEEDEDGLSEWDIPVTSGETVPEDAAEKRELILAVRRAVESLPEEQRRVIVLRDLDGLPYQEISDILGVELGTVKSRLSRGRANLKTILEKGNFF